MCDSYHTQCHKLFAPELRERYKSRALTVARSPGVSIPHAGDTLHLVLSRFHPACSTQWPALRSDSGLGSCPDNRHSLFEPWMEPEWEGRDHSFISDMRTRHLYFLLISKPSGIFKFSVLIRCDNHFSLFEDHSNWFSKDPYFLLASVVTVSIGFQSSCRF